MSLHTHDVRQVRAEIEARYHHRHGKYFRRDSSLDIIRRTHGRDAWEDTHRDSAR